MRYRAEHSLLGASIRRLRAAGPRRIATAIHRRTIQPLRGHSRGRWLARRPLRVGRSELRAALGSVELAEALRGSALAALPIVAAFERSLETLDPGSRQSLLERADEVAKHRFDLLGSGPIDLGPTIDWSRDFDTGQKWPMEHRDLLEVDPPGSDVKMPWELSRFQHLPLLAAAFRLSGERRYLEEMGAQLDSWIEANPVEFGVNWVCTMDVAIRAANWVAALVIAAPDAAEEAWAERAAASLLLHGRFIRRYPEIAPIRGNHYLSDLVGLLVVASLFNGSEEGRAWRKWATRELVSEMDHEVRSDGCDHEASIPYHRLVAELFVCGTQAVESFAPGSFPSWYETRLAQMLDFIVAYTRPDGLAPQVGDNDDGRFLPLGDYGRTDPRSHLHVLEQAGRAFVPSSDSAAYPAGGYFILRDGDIYLLIRCGDTGLGGLGGHAHNDQLSFELCFRDEPLIEDPGTYRYSPDPRLRDLFRSTAFHATLQVDREEQNPLPPWPRFPIGDRTRAEVIEWSPERPRPAFAGRHRGFEHLSAPVEYERRFELDPEASTLTLTDAITSTAPHELEWSFPLGRCRGVAAGSGHAAVEFERLSLRFEAPGLEFAVRDGWYSPSYGVKEPRQFLGAKRTSDPGRHVVEVGLRIVDAERV